MMSDYESTDVLDENGHTVNPLDDDYDYYRYSQNAETDPLSDDYIREEYE